MRLSLCAAAYVLGYESGSPQRIASVIVIAALLALLIVAREVQDRG